MAHCAPRPVTCRPYTAHCWAIKKGTVVAATHDPAARTISFSVAGVDCGVAFRNVPADLPLHPAVLFCRPAQFTFVAMPQ